MKIAILHDDYPPRHFGGAGAVAHLQARELVRQGHEVLAITSVQRPEHAGAYEIDGVRVRALHSSYPMRQRAWRSLENKPVVAEVERILADFKPDIVHAHNVHTHLSYASLQAAKRSGARVCMTFHDGMTISYGKIPATGRVSVLREVLTFRRAYNPWRNYRIRQYLLYVDRRIAVSQALADALRHGGIRSDYVVHNGLVLEDWNISEDAVERFREVQGLEGKKIMFFGGRLSTQKGGEAAIRTLAAVVERVPEVVLLVAGKTEGYAEEMRTLAETLRVGKRMVFTGWLTGEELRAAYAASDVVCVLSTYLDPFPTMTLEAMAAKRPVIATEFGGAKEAVAEGETGYIVDPREIQTVVQRTEELLTNPQKAAAFGEAGYARLKSRFTIAQCVDKLLRAYTD